MATISDVTTVDYSGDLRVDSLLFDTVDWNYLLPYRTTLFYTFDLSVVNSETPAMVTAFNVSQRAAAIEIMNETARVTGISFAQVASGALADIHFGAYNLAGGNTAGLTHTSEQYSYGSGNALTSYEGEAFVFLDNAEFAYINNSPTAGSEGYEVLLHEIAHALGLGHPFDGLYQLPASEDNTNNTVMSYTHAGANKTTYQWYDLLALQWIYGEDGLRGSYGMNSVYGPSLAVQAPLDEVAPELRMTTPSFQALNVAVNANLTLSFSEDIARGTGTIFLITSAGATVESFNAATSSNLSYAGATLTVNPSANLAYSTGYRLVLAAGAIKDLAGNSYEGTSSYTFTTAADPTNQTFSGTTASDTFSGGTGNDVINGGAGVDTAVYSGRFADYVLNYQRATGTATLTDRRLGGDGVDQLTSIERLQFADKSFELLNLPRTGSPAYGQTPSFLFDAAFYLLSNPHLVPNYKLVGAFTHYNLLGAPQGYAPNAWFDPQYYANKWPDLTALNLDAQTLFAHYNLYGVWEGRSAGPDFDRYDGARYLRENPDVAVYVDANVQDFLGSRSNGAIAHYVIYGADEGRVAYDLSGVLIDMTILIGF